MPAPAKCYPRNLRLLHTRFQFIQVRDDALLNAAADDWNDLIVFAIHLIIVPDALCNVLSRHYYIEELEICMIWVMAFQLSWSICSRSPQPWRSVRAKSFHNEEINFLKVIFSSLSDRWLGLDDEVVENKIYTQCAVNRSFQTFCTMVWHDQKFHDLTIGIHNSLWTGAWSRYHNHFSPPPQAQLDRKWSLTPLSPAHTMKQRSNFQITPGNSVCHETKWSSCAIHCQSSLIVHHLVIEPEKVSDLSIHIVPLSSAANTIWTVFRAAFCKKRGLRLRPIPCRAIWRPVAALLWWWSRLFKT